MEKPDRKVTCYSGGEGAFMAASQRWRGRALQPILAGFERIGLRPNHLTFLSLLAGLAFCPLLLWIKPLAFGFLLAHLLLDGLDGPLARRMGVASNRGSFTDTMSDQVVIAATALFMVHTGYAAPLPAGLYVFFYTLVVVFAMVRNALNVPYAWLFRPRFLIYGWFVVEIYLWPDTLNVVLWLATLLLAAKTLTAFIRIRRKI